MKSKANTLAAIGLMLLGALSMSGLVGSGLVSHAVQVTPGNVSSGLVLWLDASDPLANGTTPTNGASIATWKDKSTAARDATVNPFGVVEAHTAAVFESAPTGFNGRPALRFTRVDDNSGSVYRVAGFDIRASATPDITVLSVYKPAALATNNGLWGNDDGNWDRFFLTYTPMFGDGIDDGIVGLGPGLGGETIPNAGVSTAPSMLAISYDGNVTGNSNSGPTNGSSVYFDCALLRTFTDSTEPTAARDHLSIGWDGNDSVFDGYLAEIIVYNRVLTSQEISQVNGYLASKYSLPTGCATFATTTTSVATTTTVAPSPTVTSIVPTAVASSPSSMVAQSSEVELANLPNTGAQGMQPGVVALLLMGAGTLLLSLRRVGRS